MEAKDDLSKLYYKKCLPENVKKPRNLWNGWVNLSEKAYQQGVPTNVFLERCLSPESKRQAETPKSPSLIAPRASMRIFPAYPKHNLRY